MVYLILLGLSVITPLFAFYFSEQMAYHLHYKKLARSDKWFWQRDLSDEELDHLAHDKSKKFEKAKTAHSLNHALSLSTKSTIWICGGEGLYKESMPLADNLYLTLINHSFDGDVFFPDWKKTFPKMISKNEVQTDKYSLEFLVFTKSSDIQS